MALKDDLNLVKRVDGYAKGLSDWEIGFIESCLNRVEGGEELTAKQRKILEDIDERKVP